MTNYALLLTPIFSRYDVLESGIINIYLKKAMNQVYQGKTNYIINLMTNTPWLLYQSYGLYNPLRTIIDPDDQKYGLGPQQVILILAYTAVVVNHMYNSSVVVVNGNGPVVNSGFASLATLASALGKKVVYWKDDARKLWGFNDNPLMLGTLPSVSDHLMDPAGFPNRLNLFDPTKQHNCGDMVLPTLLANAVHTPPSPQTTLSPTIINLNELGRELNIAFSSGPITWGNILQDPVASYRAIKKVFITYGKSLISPRDFDYISPALMQTPHIVSKVPINMSRSQSIPNPLQPPPPNPITLSVLSAYNRLATM